jgi:hypothetical protein
LLWGCTPCLSQVCVVLCDQSYARTHVLLTVQL